MPSGPPKPKKYDPIKTIKKVSRDSDPHKGSRRGGFHSTPKGDRGYTRKEKHPGKTDDGSSEALTPEDETYREMMFPIADVLSWDIPAEGRPCGEGEDPKRGKCNPNISPIGPEEYRNDPAEWERETDKYIDEEAKKNQRWERQQREPYSNEPIPHPDDVGVDPAFRGGGGPMTGPQIDQTNELDDNLDSSSRLVDTAKRMGLHDGRSDALMRQWQQENPEADDQQMLVVLRDHYERKIMGYTIAELNWSTHKSETFDDTGKKGLHPAWGLKSIIDRGVKPHEKQGADKRIGEAEHQTTQRDIPSKKFKSYSMVHAFEWVIGDLPFEGAAPPFGSKDEDDETEESEE